MLEFTIAKDDFRKACKLMSSNRNNMEGDMVDITATRDSVSFQVTGRDATFPAAVERLGVVQLPLELFARLGKAAGTYKESDLRLKIDAGRVRLNSMSFAVPPIQSRPVGRRIIELPDDALPIDLLALPVLFTPAEIEESNLTARVLAANSARLKALQRAGDDLLPFGIDANMLDELHKEVIRQHADKLRHNLLPDLFPPE